MEAQEVFDRVATHLLTQNEKSTTNLRPGSAPSCAYRGSNGLMCAVGCLIPDEAYDPKMESKPVTNLLWNSHPWYDSVSWMEEHVSLLDELQGIHDWHEPHEWPVLLRNVAINRRLAFNPPGEKK